MMSALLLKRYHAREKAAVAEHVGWRILTELTVSTGAWSTGALLPVFAFQLAIFVPALLPRHSDS